MKTPLSLAPVMLLAVCCSGTAFAQAAVHAPLDLAYGTYSSSGAGSSLDNVPEAPSSATARRPAGASLMQAEPARASYRPFLSYAVGFRIGSGGLGGEVATPLAHRLNLRVGAQAFDYSTSITTDGVTANGDLTLQNIYASVDYFPFHGSFHVSPGISIHNDNHLGATLFVPGGQTLTLGDVDYTSDATDPIHGTTHIFFGKKVAPRITAGFGNVFPRSGGHWSFPTEFGFEYASYPTMQLSLSGSGCSDMGCGKIDSPDNQANIEAERQKIVNDLAPLRFYPILSFGVSYRIGYGR